MQVKQITQNYNQNKTKSYQPQFAGISIGRKIPDNIVQVIANSKSMADIAKKYQLRFGNYHYNDICGKNFLDFSAQRLREASKTLVGRIVGFLAPTKGKVYDLTLFDDKTGDVASQVSDLSVEKIEGIIARKDYEAKLKAEIKTDRKEALNKIAQM